MSSIIYTDIIDSIISALSTDSFDCRKEYSGTQIICKSRFCTIGIREVKLSDSAVISDGNRCYNCYCTVTITYYQSPEINADIQSNIENYIVSPLINSNNPPLSFTVKKLSYNKDIRMLVAECEATVTGIVKQQSEGAE